MPFGYLGAIALLTWCTFFALVAPRRAPLLSGMSFGFGFVINELPFLAVYCISGSTLLAAVQGDLASPGGRAVLGLAVATTAGLLIVTWRGLRAGQLVEAALSEGLGADWRAALDAGTAARLRRRLPFARILFRPVLVRRWDVERVADIRYGDAGRRNLLDVYRHRSRPEGAPVLIHLHGGGFHRGKKDREARPLLYRLASQGWVCVSANYRLQPHARFPDHLIDAKKVIAWVRAHGHEHGADTSTLFISGSSAGGHMACMAALTPNDPVFQPGFEQADTSVTAAISLYGYYGPAVAEDQPPSAPSAPSAYFRPDAPPFFLAHGDNDTLVPVESARAFADRLRAASSSCVVYAELSGAQHSFDRFHSLRFEAVVDGVEAFAAWVRSRQSTQHEDAQQP